MLCAMRSWHHIVHMGAVITLLWGGCDAPQSVTESQLLSQSIVKGLTIPTGQGAVRGVLQGDVRAWRGLPFAVTPTGAHRFRPPAAHPHWSGVLDVTKHGLSCARADLLSGKYDANSGEDCLHLAVYSPHPAPSAALPVMVWVEGGPFIYGEGGLPLSDGVDLVRDHDVVVVAVNYRQGALGFLRLPELVAEDGDKMESSANLGLQDQVAALRWVRDNIGAFGGDRDNVTLFGQSAGGTSVCALLTTVDSAGLFRRAIIQSGLCHVRLPSADFARQQGLKLAAALGCTVAGDRAACLRGKPVQHLVSAVPGKPSPPGGPLFAMSAQPLWSPFVDGQVLTAQPAAMLDTSLTHFVQVLIGSNRDEARLFHQGLLGDTLVSNDKEYLHAIGRRFGNRAHEIVGKYPPGDHGGRNMALAQVATDAFFTCPARRTAKALAAYTTTYRYQFEHQPTATALDDIGVFHSAELPYVFGNDGGMIVGAAQGNGLLVSALMQRYWTRFATTGDPNGGDDPTWSTWTAKDEHMRIAQPAKQGEGLKTDICDFWDTIPFHEELP